jgi:hypothetical protein
MIDVRCLSCGHEFSVADSLAGSTEFCPECGALIDIPKIDDGDLESESSDEVAAEAESVGNADDLVAVASAIATTAERHPAGSDSEPLSRRGVPAPIWWFAIILISGGFVSSLFYLFRDNWEERHVDELATDNQKAALLMNAGDYDAANREYQIMFDLVGYRRIVSVRLQGMLADAHRQQQLAVQYAKAPPAAPSTNPSDLSRLAGANAPDATSQPAAPSGADLASSGSPTSPTSPATQSATASATAEKAAQVARAEAIKRFQREAEGFPQFVLNRPTVYQDAKNQWHQREYIIWGFQPDLSRSDATPAEIVVQFTALSHSTRPHATVEEARKDFDYAIDDTDKPGSYQTTFVLGDAGGWEISRDYHAATIEGFSIVPPNPYLTPDRVDLVDLNRYAKELFTAGK